MWHPEFPPTALVPVLIGDWSPEAEAKILATFDPVSAMAAGDADAYGIQPGCNKS